LLCGDGDGEVEVEVEVETMIQVVNASTKSAGVGHDRRARPEG
jgi:hypothetical protein